MALIKLLQNLQVNQNQLKQPAIDNLSSAPTNAVLGQLYYNTTGNQMWVCTVASPTAPTWTVFSTGTTPDATTGAKGIVQLAGDLGGSGTTAAAPVITAGAITTTKLADASVTGGTAGSGVKIAATTITAANIANATITDTQVAAANKDGTAGTPSLRTLGTGSTQAMAGNTTLSTIASPGTSGGTISIGSNRLINVTDPSSAQDAATKNYVDATSQGLAVKPSVRVATTGTETYTIASGAVTTISGTTIDGVSPAVNDRVLVKDAPASSGAGSANSTQPANGIYTVTSNTTNLSLSRVADMNTGTQVPGAFVFVEAGTTNTAAGYVVGSGVGPYTINTTAISWTQFSGAGEITAGNGLSKSGNTLTVVGTANRILVSGSGVDIHSSYIGQTSITTLGTITTGTWTGATIAVANGGTGTTSAGVTAAHNIGAAGIYNSGTIGDGSTTSFVITHNLNNTDPTVQVWEAGATGSQAFPDIQKTSANTITLVFAVAPASGAYKCVVVG